MGPTTKRPDCERQERPGCSGRERARRPGRRTALFSHKLRLPRLLGGEALFLYDLRGFVPAIPQGLHSKQDVACVY
jgi:hypothetical protein